MEPVWVSRLTRIKSRSQLNLDPFLTKTLASPHVAGLSAYIMALENLTTPDSVTARIKNLAMIGNGTVKSPGVGSPTLIAYNGSGG